MVEMRAGMGSGTHVSLLCTPAISAVCDHHLLDSGCTVIRDFVYGKEPVVLESSYFIF